MREQRARLVYWTLPLLLTGVQLVFSVRSASQLRYEELAESVRNVFWLDHRLLYDRVSSNVGWYGLLLGIYRIGGFSLFVARGVRVVLQLTSLLCLASLLERFLGVRRAWLPLLAWGLSPTLLAFNCLQAAIGV